MAFNLKVIKKDEMSRIHIQNVAKKLQIKGPLGHLNKWEDSIKVDLTEAGCEVIKMVQVRVQ